MSILSPIDEAVALSLLLVSQQPVLLHLISTQMLGYINPLGIQMAESGNVEKFPDEWNIQFLGSTLANQLASGTPIDLLIKR